MASMETGADGTKEAGADAAQDPSDSATTEAGPAGAAQDPSDDAATEAGSADAAELDCTEGEFFADCGGNDDPAFGCRSGTSDKCRWFVGGAQPSDYVMSECPPDDLCCIDNWPFEQDVSVGSTFEQLYAWGLQPWNAERATDVAVRVDTELSVENANLRCEGTHESVNPCDSGVRIERLWHDESFVVFLRPEQAGFTGWKLAIEVIGTDDPVARVCKLPWTDVATNRCRLIERSGGASCASTGTLTLDSAVSSLEELERVHARFSAEFEEGVVEGSF